MDKIKPSNPKNSLAGTRAPLWLLPTAGQVAQALAHFAGALKYGLWNWRISGARTSVYLSAARRHLEAYENGEELDPVDGTHNLGNVMACCAIVLDAEAAGKLEDDRPPPVDVRPIFAAAERTAADLIAKAVARGAPPRHYTIRDELHPAMAMAKDADDESPTEPYTPIPEGWRPVKFRTGDVCDDPRCDRKEHFE